MKDSREIKLPNFLIVGAAKCGTTSLYYYLKEHPEIYMSPVKEPKFITSNFLKFPFAGVGDEEVEKNIVKSFKDYCQLFENVKGEQAIGEASADNLYYYEKSISYIKKYLGSPRIIIILRNPVERAYSAYLHLVRDKRESLSFEEALKKEEMRKKQNWEFIWFYKDVGFYYRQVKAYLDSFQSVRVYLYDDLLKNTLSVIQDICEFLGVDNSFTPNVNEKYNVSLIPRSRWLHRFLTQPNLLKNAVKSFLKPVISDRQLAQLVENTKALNLYKPQMKEKTRKYLAKHYQNDILKLQKLIDRDLTHWLS